MWLRHAFRLLFTLIVISACSPRDRQAVDKLNSLSYAYHYRNIDSAAFYAQQAFELSTHYSEGKAEALNNIAFVKIVQMRYDEAKALLDEVVQTTDNSIELLVAYVQQMRLCQRRSHNRSFYDYQELAYRALGRINEERFTLNDRQQQRMIYAESELAIVSSTYYYYVGLDSESADALHAVPPTIERDTAQFLNYLYNVGSGGIVKGRTAEEVNQIEFDHLLRCLLLSEQAGYLYFSANSLEALADHLNDSVYAKQLMTDNMPAMKFINTWPVPDYELPVKLAEESLDLFTEFGDVYQIAGAHRTLASCYLSLGDYEMAINYLYRALGDSAIDQAPDLVASIREQLSVAFAAVNDKPLSDQNRNIYLDMQEQTRQDRSLEARAGQLEQSVAQLNQLLWAVGGALLLLVGFVSFQYFWYRKRTPQHDEQLWKEREVELKEQLALAHLHVENAQRRNLEQRAKVSLVNSITPFIGRMKHEVERLDDNNREERLEYVCELTDKINEQNNVLTHWIQLRQGELTLHIETFNLQELFDFVGKSKSSFRQKGITLDVHPTEERVKADKVLTLFMLNTLADNARKYTPEGGQVVISAMSADDYVEISVRDTGLGMDEEQLAHVFEHKISGGHGFGLLNCKGIIEKYRKVSSIFKVCQLSAESIKGEGSRFFFRLPKGMAKVLMLMLSLSGVAANAMSVDPLAKASVYADSAYFSNINGTYQRTLMFADSCRYYLNTHFRLQRPESTDTMMRMNNTSMAAPEILWLHDSILTNYNIILDIRNESAVAALALHEWPLYSYNNRIYTQLFKELSADQHLADYCRKMQQSESNKSIAILLLVLLFVLAIVALVWYIVLMLNRSARHQQEQQEKLELMNDELQRLRYDEAGLHVANAVLDNCLSTLKHETMYYPSRIRQLIDSGETASLSEVTAYYNNLYAILSEQAMRQVEYTKLHLKPLEHGILGDPVLIDYLFELLRKQTNKKSLNIDYSYEISKYVVCRVQMNDMHLSEEQVANLFTSAGIENIPYLLCRQIVRDHGEASGRRGCAIRAEQMSNQLVVVVILPRANNNIKNPSDNL